MNQNRKMQSSLSKTVNKDVVRKDNNFESTDCPFGDSECKEILDSINGNFIESYGHHSNKDFIQSIIALKRAFFESSELKNTKCSRCAVFFRATITDQVVSLHDEFKDV